MPKQQTITPISGVTITANNAEGLGGNFRGVMFATPPDNNNPEHTAFADGNLWYVNSQATGMPALVEDTYWSCYKITGGVWNLNTTVTYGKHSQTNTNLPDVEEKFLDMWINLNEATATNSAIYYRAGNEWRAFSFSVDLSEYMRIVSIAPENTVAVFDDKGQVKSWRNISEIPNNTADFTALDDVINRIPETVTTVATAFRWLGSRVNYLITTITGKANNDIDLSIAQETGDKVPLVQTFVANALVYLTGRVNWLITMMGRVFPKIYFLTTAIYNEPARTITGNLLKITNGTEAEGQTIEITALDAIVGSKKIRITKQASGIWRVKSINGELTGVYNYATVLRYPANFCLGKDANDDVYIFTTGTTIPVKAVNESYVAELLNNQTITLQPRAASFSFSDDAADSWYNEPAGIPADDSSKFAANTYTTYSLKGIVSRCIAKINGLITRVTSLNIKECVFAYSAVLV